MEKSIEAAVLFADVSGSTKLYDTVGDKIAFAAVQQCVDAFIHATGKNGGRVIETIGDEVMAVFPDAGAAPVAAYAPGPVRPRRVKAGRHAAAAAMQPEAEAAPEPELARAELRQPDPAERRAPMMDLPPEADLDGFDIDIDEDDGDEGNVFSDSKSFGDFAERLGATQLPDLIEAAAVYCAMVLKRPEFSRPLVLRQVAELPAGAGLAREDCLRSFGYLMRKGRIAKIRAGHFAVTLRSALLAEALRNAG